MMMRKSGTAWMLLGFVILLASCGKYEDGPAFSLSSKRSRVINVWKVETVSLNGNDYTSLWKLLYPQFSLDIQASNDYITTWSPSLVETGQWRFDASRENVITTPYGSGQTTTWRILRLKSDELWVETISGNDKSEYHMTPK